MSTRGRRAVVLTVAFSLGLGGLTSTSVASADDSPPPPDDTVSIVTEPVSVTVLGLDEYEVGDSVPLDELITQSESVDQPITDQLGDALEEVDASEVAPASSLHSSTGPQIVLASTKKSRIVQSGSTDYWIKSTWQDNKNLTVALRWGSSTWGWSKISAKHDVTVNMIKKTTQFPRSRDVQGNSYVYVTPANHFTCWLAACWIDKTMDVKVVSDNTKLSDRLPKGVITSYCIGVTVCPQWVRDAAG